MLEKEVIFRTHLAGVKWFNVAHKDDVVTVEGM